VVVVFNRSSRPLHLTLPVTRLGEGPFADWLGSGLKMERRQGQWILDLPERGAALLGR
jgi:hypothetical protein